MIVSLTKDFDSSRPDGCEHPAPCNLPVSRNVVACGSSDACMDSTRLACCHGLCAFGFLDQSCQSELCIICLEGVRHPLHDYAFLWSWQVFCSACDIELATVVTKTHRAKLIILSPAH